MEGEEEQVPIEYIRKNKSVESLIERIICITPTNSILSSHQAINKLKLQML